MLKQLTLAVLTGALLPACILQTDDTTTSNSGSSSSEGTTGLTSTTDPTSGTTDPTASEGSTINPTSEGSSTTVETPTTGGTTSDTVTATGSTTDPTDGTTAENTTGQSGYGKCGWFAEDKYYACESDGAVASLEDPDGISPIACPEGLVEGEKCDEEMGPVKGVGCCTPEGDVYFCDSADTNSIIKQECGL